MVTQLAKLRITYKFSSLLFSFERPGLFLRGFVFFDIEFKRMKCGCGLVAQLARAHD